MIYVDALQTYGQGAVRLAPNARQWCHMATDDHSPEGIERLHLAAEAIGLRRQWFQNKPNHPHYDLTATKRAAALRLKDPVTRQPMVQAIEDPREFVRTCFAAMLSSSEDQGELHGRVD